MNTITIDRYLGAPSAKLWPAGTQYRIIAALHAALAQQAEPVEPDDDLRAVAQAIGFRAVEETK
jgi:hypothetical protein